MTPYPWDAPSALRGRLREAAWQAIGWPYIVALAITALFFACVLVPRLNPQAGLVGTYMTAMWAATFLNRQGAKLADAKAEQIKQNGGGK